MQRPQTEQDRARLLMNLRSSFFLPPLLEHRYAIQRVIGEGSYGVVCSAKNRETNELVAVKRIIGVLEETPEATRTLRELKFLRLLGSHENIISIKDVLLPSERDNFNDVFLVLELMPADLSRVMRANIPLTNDHIRWLMYQLLRGIAYLHSAKVYHRDLKPSNILINAACDLRIIDFGLARLPISIQPDAPLLTDYVATRWYRAPELIVCGASHYTTAIDMWSVGVIFGELLNNGNPLFPGINSQNQVERILAVCKSAPSEAMKTAMANSPLYASIISRPNNVPAHAADGVSPTSFQQLLPNADAHAINLLELILQVDPAKRLSAAEAMEHPYFDSLHEPSAVITREPIPAEEFAFERQNLSRDDLRKLFLEEILRYHPEQRENYLNGRRNAAGANGNININTNTRNLATRGQADDVRQQFKATRDGGPQPKAWESMPESHMAGFISQSTTPNNSVVSSTVTSNATGNTSTGSSILSKVSDGAELLPRPGRKCSEGGMNINPDPANVLLKPTRKESEAGVSMMIDNNNNNNNRTMDDGDDHEMGDADNSNNNSNNNRDVRNSNDDSSNVQMRYVGMTSTESATSQMDTDHKKS